MDSELQRISQLIREKAFAQAEDDLRAYVKQNPQSPQAFYLLSYACDQPRERLAAIRRAHKLAPESDRITTRFRKLESGQDRPRRSRWSLLPLVLVTLLMLGALLVGLWVTFRDRLPASLGGPTLALPTAIVILPTATVDQQATQAIQATATAIVATNNQVGTHVANTATAVAVLNAAASTTPEFTNTPVATSTPAPTTTPIVLLTPTPSLTPFVAPTAIPFFEGLPPPAPVGSTADVAVGQLTVRSFYRAAEVFINEIGATIDPPPAGTEWALLELQLICSGDGDCTPPLDALAVVDNTGVSYLLATTEVFQVDPRFGPEGFANNQTYGYAAVALPPEAAGLALTVIIDGQAYTFALE